MQDKIFLKAYWETANKALIFLSQDWEDETLRLPISFEPNGMNWRIERVDLVAAGLMSGYYMDDENIHFVMDHTQYPAVDGDDEVYVAGEFNRWEAAIENEKFRLKPFKWQGKSLIRASVPIELLAGKFSSTFRFVTRNKLWVNVPDNAPNWVPGKYQGSDFSLSLRQSGRHVFRIITDTENSLDSNLILCWKDVAFEEKILVSASEFYLSMQTKADMGVIQRMKSTVFRLFAPRATRVTLELFTQLDGSDKAFHELEKKNNGLWELKLSGSYLGSYYYYYVDGMNRDASTFFDYTQPLVDPYAKAMYSPSGPGIIIDDNELNTDGDIFHPPLWHDLIIVEAHVRDLVAKAPIELEVSERQGFKGVTKWVRHHQSYLKTLGVNAIELQPIQEFEYNDPNEYHWGYMPVNYFSVSSAFGSNREKAKQVEEFHELVRTCHDEGFSVILDVVYNHLGSPNPLFSIDKHYYFELDSNYNLSNWSGVGNDMRCSAPMMKRIIIDSLTFLIKKYNVDGFRFDLAELIGRDVLIEIERALKKVKPSVILIAEPWSFRGHIADKLRVTGFSSWNDRYRDFFVHYLRNNGDPRELEYYMKGSPVGFTRFPAQTVNYSESHDDYAFLDLITENENRDGSHPTLNDIRRNHLMLSLLMVSLGIPMISAGQDFNRSKFGIRNTYQKGDINALDYSRMITFSQTHEYFRNWINFRRSAAGHLFRLEFPPKEGYMQFFYSPNARAFAVLYNADYSMGSEQLLYAINPELHTVEIEIPEFDLERYRQIADHNRFAAEGLEVAMHMSQGDQLILPGLSCGLWQMIL